MLIIISASLISNVSAADMTDNMTVITDSQYDESLSLNESVTPSTYTPSDGNALIECINSASDGDTVILNGTYFLKSTLKIDKSVKIIGQRNDTSIKPVDFSVSDIRLAEISSSNVLLTNIRFIGSSYRDASAIYWTGDNGSIIGCEFESNIAKADGFGGALAVSGKNILIENSLFTNNRATRSSAGALSVTGDGAIIKNCEFIENSADNGSAGAVALLADECVIENCSFKSNSAADYGGAVAVSGKSNRISNSTFKNNNVKISKKGGGAVYSDCEDFTIDNCTFHKNTAPASMGGAVYAEKHSTVRYSSFTANTALIGNAIYSPSYSNVMHNYFAIKFNESEGEAVNVSELTDFNNTFEEIKEDSSVTFTASMIFEYSSSGSIYVTVDGGSIDLENITVLNHTEAKITLKDNVLRVSNLAVGNYTLRVITTPDEAHNSVESYLPITVKKATAVITGETIKVALKRGTKWTIKLINAKSKKPIKNMKLTLKIYTGKKYITTTVKTNSKGIATYQTKNLAKGTHKVVVSGKDKGYDFNTFTSSIKVVKPVKLTFKVKKTTNKQGALLSITVYKKSTKKQINNVKLKVIVYTGKKTKTTILKSKTIKGFKGVCGYGTNELTVGTHKVVIKPFDIEYTGSATSKMTITKSAKKIKEWTKIR